MFCVCARNVVRGCACVRVLGGECESVCVRSRYVVCMCVSVCVRGGGVCAHVFVRVCLCDVSVCVNACVNVFVRMRMRM